jgi:hypothetical protein
MYIVVEFYREKPIGKAKLMTEADYENIAKHFNGPVPLQIIDVADVDKLPKDLFTCKKVQQYVKKQTK